MGLNKAWLGLLALALACGTTLAADAPAADGGSLLAALRKGGCYIVMRHASSPRDPPAEGSATPGNVNRERQLDAEGRESARAMGEAVRRLHVPIGEVLSSPTWRAQETVKEAGFGSPRLVQELGDGGRGMAASGDAQRQWLQREVMQPVRRGNTVIVTHFPNLRAAFPEHAADLADGEALIFAPDGTGAMRFLRRVRIEEWPLLR
jgi:phosphohistidine phosphatase SixA